MRDAALAFSLVLLATAAGAQISPGELSRAHAELDQNDRCLECHRQGQGVDANLCLTCHDLLKQRIDGGKGLHAQPDYRKCYTCHIEHHGRGFELVYWGDGGPDALDHDLTGFVLEGKHATLGCRDCHQSDLIHAREDLLAAGKDLDRTFLGLDTACLSCHTDPHRSQFEEAPCRSCHELSAWIPAPLFDHQETSFPLTGRHRNVECDQCHPTLAVSADVSFVRYRGIAASSCMDCHDDPHESRFGTQCESCHTTDNWQAWIDEASFDHDRTPFPLRGLHSSVECQDCHTSGKLIEPIPEFERCESCHDDVHEGQFHDRPDGGDCRSCHDVEGFRPSRYTLEDHQSSSYPLEGSHLAVPCLSCHSDAPSLVGQAAPADLLGESRDTSSGHRDEARLSPSESAGTACPTKMTRFMLESAACTACHEGAHAGTLDAYLEPDSSDTAGCVSCHDLRTWQSISFDHGRSAYPLEGRHVDVSCESCHPRQDDDLMQLSGVPTHCAGCHEDTHAGQFDHDEQGQPRLRQDGRVVTCEVCHTVHDWQPSLFDHNRDAAYKLEGAHLEASCEGCHPTEGELVRYRPRPTACADCHQGGL